MPRHQNQVLSEPTDKEFPGYTTPTWLFGAPYSTLPTWSGVSQGFWLGATRPQGPENPLRFCQYPPNISHTLATEGAHLGIFFKEAAMV